MKKKLLFFTEKDALFDGERLFRLLWPLVVEQLLSVLIGMIDVLMVACIGETAVSGVSLVDSVNHLILQVLFALTAGGTVVCARFVGKRDVVSAGKSCAQLIQLAGLFMCCVTVLFLAGGRGLLFRIFGSVEQAVMDNSMLYMRITCLSFPFLALYHAVSAGFRAKGNTRIAMLVSLGMNIANILGNAICIFGLHMGVAGVAIPTLLVRIAGAAVILFFFQREENEIRIRYLRQMKPDGLFLRKILSIGVPNSVESALFNVGKIILQSLVSTLGTASIAAYAVASNLATYFYLPGNALGAGMMTITAQCYGANRPDQAKKYARLLVGLNYAMLALICTAMICGRRFWVSCYHLSPVSAGLAEGLVFGHAVAMIIWPIAFLLPYYFRSTGHAAFTMAVSVFTMAVFRVGLAYVFVKILRRNVLWVWYAMFIDWIFRTIVFGIAFRRAEKDKTAKNS